jgi:hypothetical protein
VNTHAYKFLEASAKNYGHIAGHAHHVQTSGFPLTPSAAERDGKCWELSLDYKKCVGALTSPFPQKMLILRECRS